MNIKQLFEKAGMESLFDKVFSQIDDEVNGIGSVADRAETKSNEALNSIDISKRDIINLQQRVRNLELDNEELKQKQQEMLIELERLAEFHAGSGTVNAESVSVTPSTLNIDEGGVEQLTVSFTPTDTTDKTGTWESSNGSAATVNSNGLVTGVSDGSATITFTSNDGSFTDTCSVTVNEVVVEELKAFPSAYGAGANATGGRGGTVLHVTNLNWNSSTGSLKWALEQTYPRVIVFDVSGEIITGNYFEPSGQQYSDFTIAGQTAPEGGITIRTGYFNFDNFDNAIIRYVRFRDKGTPSGLQTDAAWFTRITNVIFDHCTFSHGRDEALDLASSQGASGNITIQNCLLTDSKTGIILGTDTRAEAIPLPDLGNFTFVNNVFSNISHRFPNTQGNGHYDIINNVVYNWKERLIRITQGGTYNVINNYYKPSNQGLRQSSWYPGTNAMTTRLQKLQAQLTDNPLIYTAGNIVTDSRTTPQSDDRNMWTYFAGSHGSFPVNTQVGSQFFTDEQFELVGVPFTIKSANDAYTDVLADVGANKYLNADGTWGFYQDTKDAADISMIVNDTFVNADPGNFAYPAISGLGYPTIPNNTRSSFYGTNQHIPAAYLTAKGVTNTLTVHNDIAPSGYTWLEEYLNEVDN